MKESCHINYNTLEVLIHKASQCMVESEDRVRNMEARNVQHWMDY
jgi:hypothetical protein